MIHLIKRMRTAKTIQQLQFYHGRAAGWLECLEATSKISGAEYYRLYMALHRIDTTITNRLLKQKRPHELQRPAPDQGKG